MTSKGSPLGRADLHHARRLRPSKPSWRTGVLRNKLDRPSVQMFPFFCFGQATFTERDGEGPWVTPTSAEEARITGIVRAPVSCGTPCVAGGSDPRIKWMFMHDNLVWT